jgi:benzoate/toluate 1,2-dioxygenase alpha subunit
MVERTDVAPAVWQAGGQGTRLEDTMGSFGFEHGHALVWTNSPPERHPLYPQLGELEHRLGRLRAEWLLRTRQLDIFPNLQLASNAAMQMRVIRPMAVDRTEMRSYCLAPVGESRDARRRRIRQYEDFFNPSGLATPDDAAAYEACQRGLGADADGWLQGHARGLRRVREGADAHAAELDIAPCQSTNGSFEMADETAFHPIWRAWRRLMSDDGMHARVEGEGA